MTPPTAESPQKLNVETVIRNATQRAGIAAILPRGPSRDELVAPRRDSKGMGGYRSWPTSDEVYRKHTPTILARIEERRAKLEALTGQKFERVYLAGSSAGGYYTGHLAIRGDFVADGYAALSGGSPRPATSLMKLPKKAFYVGYGTQDQVGADAEALGALFKKAGWKVMIAAHETTHGAREIYLDEAFKLFAE